MISSFGIYRYHKLTCIYTRLLSKLTYKKINLLLCALELILDINDNFFLFSLHKSLVERVGSAYIQQCGALVSYWVFSVRKDKSGFLKTNMTFPSFAANILNNDAISHKYLAS